MEAGGGAARIMSPLPSAPRPPGPHALVGSTRRCGWDFYTAETPGTFLGPPVAGVSLRRCGPRAVGEWRTPPPLRAETRVCARVCAGGAPSAPTALKRGPRQDQDLEDGPPSPVVAKGRWISPHTSQPRSSGDLCTPKRFTVPPISFPPCPSSQKISPIFLSGFVASLHCSSLAIPHTFALLVLSARAQGPPGLRSLCPLGTHRPVPGKPQKKSPRSSLGQEL